MVYGSNIMNMCSMQTASFGSNPWGSLCADIFSTAQNIAYMSMMPSYGYGCSKMYIMQSVFGTLGQIGNAVGQSVAQNQATKANHQLQVDKLNKKIQDKCSEMNKYLKDGTTCTESNYSSCIADDYDKDTKKNSYNNAQTTYNNAANDYNSAKSTYEAAKNDPTQQNNLENLKSAMGKAKDAMDEAKTKMDEAEKEYKTAEKNAAKAEKKVAQLQKDIKELLERRDEEQAALQEETDQQTLAALQQQQLQSGGLTADAASVQNLFDENGSLKSDAAPTVQHLSSLCSNYVAARGETKSKLKTQIDAVYNKLKDDNVEISSSLQRSVNLILAQNDE